MQTARRDDPLRRLRLVITLGALMLALVHIMLPTLSIEAITLTLLLIALLPWLAPIFKSIELPGGLKIQFHDLQQAAIRAEQAGLLAPKKEAPEPEFTFQQVAQEDRNLALAGLRLEI